MKFCNYSHSKQHPNSQVIVSPSGTCDPNANVVDNSYGYLNLPENRVTHSDDNGQMRFIHISHDSSIFIVMRNLHFNTLSSKQAGKMCHMTRIKASKNFR